MLTRMPRAAYSVASDFVTPFNPPLVSDASADGTLVLACSTRLVDTLTMCPPPWPSIASTALRVTSKKPRRFTPVTRSKSSSVYSVNGFATNTPALFTNVSIRPKASSPCSMIRRPIPGVARSPGTARTNGSSEGWMDLEFATTAYPSLR